MKEVEQFSIGGYVFALEKDAVGQLSSYITELETHYLPQEGGKEILEGIEERIAELLSDKVSAGGVVTLSNVQGIIDIIGRPETIEADNPQAEAPSGKGVKKLFRDIENKRLGGVCSGFAAYFGVDVTVIRIVVTVIAAAVFFGGISSGAWSFTIPFVYCILWIAMPPARTAQDRWAMRGDNGSLDDIRRNVRSGIQEMGETAREVGRGDFFRNFGRAFLVFVGLILLLVGTSGLASAAVLSLKGDVLFGTNMNAVLQELYDNVPWAYDFISTPWLVALLALAILLPFVGMLYGGIQLLFGFKNPSWRPGLLIFMIWLIIMVVLMVIFFAGALSQGYYCDWW